MRVTDFAFNFRFRCQCRNGVDNDNVNCARTCQRITDFQCLLTGIRLRTQKIIDIYTEFTGIDWIQRVLCIDKRTGFAFALC
ncbi:hypothetical protein D3C80_1816020 [compost metagenome]